MEMAELAQVYTYRPLKLACIEQGQKLVLGTHVIYNFIPISYYTQALSSFHSYDTL